MLYTISSLKNINTGFPISQVALSEDGSFAAVAPDATVAARNYITIFNTITGAITNVTCPDTVTWSAGIAISPDMQRIYANGGTRIYVFKKTNNVWAYERLLPNGGANCTAIGVASDNIDIAYNANGVVTFYNTQTNSAYNTTGSGNATPFHTIGGFATTPYNAFVLARTSSVANSVNQWVKIGTTYVQRLPDESNAYDCWYTSDGGSITAPRLNVVNGNFVGSTNFINKELELAQEASRTATFVTGERTIAITNEIYFSIPTSNPVIINVKSTETSQTLYTINHTVAGRRVRYRNGQFISFTDSESKFDVVNLKTAGDNTNVKITPLTTVQYSPRSFRNTSVSTSLLRDRYFAISGLQSGKNTYRSSSVIGLSFTNTVPTVVTGSTTANTFTHGSSNDGRMSIVGRPEGYSYVRMSQISEYTSSSSTALSTTNGLNKIYAVSPSGEYVAIPGSSGLVMRRYTRSNTQSSITTTGMSAVDYLGTMFLSEINLLALRTTNIDILAQGTGSTAFVRQNTILHGTDNATNFVRSDNNRRVAILYQTAMPRIYIFATPATTSPTAYNLTGTNGTLSEPRGAAFSPSGNRLFVRDTGNTWAMYSVTDASATKVFSHTFPKTAKLNPIWLSENVVRVFFDNDRLSHRNFLVGSSSITDITNLGFVDSLPTSNTWNTTSAPNGNFIIRTGFTDNNNTTVGTNTTLLYNESAIAGNYRQPIVLGPQLPNYQTSLAAIGPDSETFVLVDNARKRFFFYEKEPGVDEPILRQTITRTTGIAKEYSRASGEFSPDGNFVAFAYGTNLLLFRKNGEIFEDITIANVGPDKSFAKFSQDGLYLYVGGNDTTTQSQPTKVFKLQGNNYVFQFDTTEVANAAIDISPDGTRAVIVSSSQTVIRTINLATGNFGSVLATFNGSLNTAKFITDSLLAVTTVTNPNIQIMELINGGLVTWPLALSSSFSTPATTISIVKIGVSEQRMLVGFPTDVNTNSSSSTDVDDSTTMLPLLFRITDDRTKGEAVIILKPITTEVSAFVSGTLSGDNVIPSIKTEGRFSDVRELEGNVLLSPFTTSVTAELLAGISGDTLIPSIQTSATSDRLPSLEGDTLLPITFETEGEITNGVATKWSHGSCYVSSIRSRQNAVRCRPQRDFYVPVFVGATVDCFVTESRSLYGNGKPGCAPKLVLGIMNTKDSAINCYNTPVRNVVGQSLCSSQALADLDKKTNGVTVSCYTTTIFVDEGFTGRKCGDEHVTINLPSASSILLASQLCHLPSSEQREAIGDRVCVPERKTKTAEDIYIAFRQSIRCYETKSDIKSVVGSKSCNSLVFSKGRTHIKNGCYGLYIPSARTVTGTKMCPHYGLLVGIQNRQFGRLYRARPLGIADIESGRQNITIR